MEKNPSDSILDNVEKVKASLGEIRTILNRQTRLLEEMLEVLRSINRELTRKR